MTEKPRTRLRRVPQRGAYERETIDPILDAALVSHLGVVDPAGFPVVIPTLHARLGDEVYVHGSSASRALRAAATEACLTVTLLDGLVLARSAFHHSVNYRSVVVFGQAEDVTAPEEKERALEAFTEKLIPGRWPDVRPPSRQELKGTAVMRIPLTEASAKVRTGPPLDEEEDYALPVWAGTVSLSTVAGEPVPDPRVAPGIAVPGYL